MRAFIAIGLCTLIACSGDKEDPSGAPAGTWTGNPATGSGTGAATGTGTGTGPATGTGTGTGTGSSDSGDSGGSTASVTTYVGDAAVDLSGLTWTGTESARVLSITSGTLLCQWTWSAQDWGSDTSVGTTPEPAVSPCTDGDGNACTFAFTVNLTGGAESAGSCGTFGFGADGGAYHYGWAEDWSNGGSSYGQQFTYYIPGGTGGSWFPASNAGYALGSWTPGGTTSGQLHYEIQKILLSTYTSP